MNAFTAHGCAFTSQLKSPITTTFGVTACGRTPCGEGRALQAARLPGERGSSG
jgi:hypothetical protein